MNYLTDYYYIKTFRPHMVQHEVIIGKPRVYGMPTQPGKLARKNARTPAQKKVIENRKEQLKAATAMQKTARKNFHLPQETAKKLKKLKKS